jgi:hypothetical protein
MSSGGPSCARRATRPYLGQGGVRADAQQQAQRVQLLRVGHEHRQEAADLAVKARGRGGGPRGGAGLGSRRRGGQASGRDGLPGRRDGHGRGGLEQRRAALLGQRTCGGFGAGWPTLVKYIEGGLRLVMQALLGAVGSMPAEANHPHDRAVHNHAHHIPALVNRARRERDAGAGTGGGGMRQRRPRCTLRTASHPHPTPTTTPQNM